jgi:hypothetical protein
MSAGFESDLLCDKPVGKGGHGTFSLLIKIAEELSVVGVFED